MKYFLFISFIVFLISCESNKEQLFFEMKLLSDDCKTCDLENRLSAENSIKDFREQMLKWDVFYYYKENQIDICGEGSLDCKKHSLGVKSDNKYRFIQRTEVEKVEFEGTTCLKDPSSNAYEIIFEKEKAILSVSVFWKIRDGCCEMFGWQDNQDCTLKFEGTAKRELSWWQKLLN